MNFFEHQDRALSKSRKLIFLFVLAVFFIILLINLFVHFSFFYFMSHNLRSPAYPEDLIWKTHACISLGAFLLIVLVSWYRVSRLKSGGDRVALDMGGVWVDSDSEDPALRRLCNIVEEMSIASGVPTPHIYVLEREEGINAFAAGYSVEDAVIAVSRGALKELNRDELQGVVAHEFTHILNGDMRINIHMMGVLYGIIVLGVIGRGFLRGSLYNSRSGKKSNGLFAFLGIALLVIGSIGVFFARLIKAAVSRQREFLADAYAVQFTRNPDGIGGALKKIALNDSGSHLLSAEKEEVSHMLFATGQSFWLSMLATHPPLEKRILAIDPDFKFENIDIEALKENRQKKGPSSFFKEDENPWAFLDSNKEDKVSSLAFNDAIFQESGKPDGRALDKAEKLMMAIPEPLLSAARARDKVLLLFFAIFLSREEAMFEKQLLLIEKSFGPDFKKDLSGLLPEAEKLHPLLSLPLIDLAFPALRQLDREAKASFLSLLVKLVHLDGRISIFEYCLVNLLKRRMKDFLKKDEKIKSFGQKGEVPLAIAKLFAVLAWQGHGSEALARRAYIAGVSHILPMNMPPYQHPVNWVEDLDFSLAVLDKLDFSIKAELMQALLMTAGSDGHLSLEEAELLRLICACFGIPVPPLLPDILA